MDVLIVLALATLALAFFYVLVTIPRWLFRSLHRYRLWRIRDCLVDDVIDGQLPADHPAVGELLEQIDHAVTRIDRYTVWDGLILSTLEHRLSDDAQAALSQHERESSADDLTREQQALLLAHRGSFTVAVAATLLLGSWLGVVLVAARVPAVLLQRHRSSSVGTSTHDVAEELAANRDEEQLSATAPPLRPYGGGTPLSEAADVATTGSWVGRQVVRAVDDSLLRGPELAGVG